MLIYWDTDKPAQKLLFSRKRKTKNYPNITLNNIQIERLSHQKHLGIILDGKLNFKEHVDSTILKVNGNSCIKKTQI